MRRFYKFRAGIQIGFWNNKINQRKLDCRDQNTTKLANKLTKPNQLNIDFVEWIDE